MRSNLSQCVEQVIGYTVFVRSDYPNGTKSRDVAAPVKLNRQKAFQDATLGDSEYTISILDCLKAIKKASELGFFDFKDFNFDEYDRLDKIAGGDLNWIVPGLGRTGSLIGSYLIKHYRMSAREAIGWMRICRPGSVIGHQQAWLEHLEPWLLKQGNLYRKKHFHDTEKLPTHEYGVYSIAEKSKQRPVIFQKTVSPPPPMQRSIRSDVMSMPRPQASRVREDKADTEDENIFLVSQEVTDKSETNIDTNEIPKTNTRSVENNNDHNGLDNDSTPFWKKCFCCQTCKKYCKDTIWALEVRCVKTVPRRCHTTWFCSFINMVAPSPSKVDKDQGWQAGTPKNGSKQKITNKGDHSERPTSSSKRGGAGESRTLRSPSRLSARPQAKNSARPNASAFGTNRSELKNFLMKSSTYKDDRANPLHSSITVTPHYASRLHNYSMEQKPSVNAAQMTPSSFSAVSQGTTQPQRRRLGRSPSPSPPPPRIIEKTRATNTPTPSEKILARNASKIALKEALSRLKGE
ncbi:hypothetical protein MSG28_013749 [Choristoneura fumiferana]|uniref:Uncharacterized protein n=1 Tax=Choristoneura fumiferana TaxID=7141 RepID=A0ACC0K8L3_CHOFU|nr:hypothetical protein MSG28_013749 [Choristoneura fumiferana]